MSQDWTKGTAERQILFCNRPVNKLFTDFLDQPLLILDSVKDSNKNKSGDNAATTANSEHARPTAINKDT